MLKRILNRNQIALILYTIVLLNIAQPASAQVSESGGKKQSPVQVAITISLCAIAMKVLERFNIP
jgi:hypothetical protein